MSDDAADFPQSVELAVVSHVAVLSDPGARLLIALSGGPDSCALLLALCTLADAGRLPRPVGAAHFHHGLRGADADKDAAFAAALCARFALPCLIGLGAAQSEPGQSPNAAAREARYAFLLEAANELGADRIATAHTHNDQAETVLGRVLRGTSVEGLAGIPARRALTPDIELIRPLLAVTRPEIEAYCAHHNVTARRDPSNQKDRYTRSRLRKRLPELASEFNPGLNSALVRLSQHARRDNELLSELTGVLWEEAVIRGEGGPHPLTPSPVTLHRPPLLAAHAALRGRVLIRAIRTALAADPVAAEQAATLAFTDRLDALLTTSAPGVMDLPGRLRVAATADHLILAVQPSMPVRVAPFAVPFSVPGSAQVVSVGLRVTAEIAGQCEACLARERRSHTIEMAYNGARVDEPIALIVRSARRGDRIAPLGMGGRTRLVRDLLREVGIPAEARDIAPVVVRADTGEIVWVVGAAQAESTRVVEGDENVVIRLRLRGGSKSSE